MTSEGATATNLHFPKILFFLQVTVVMRVPGARCTALRSRGADVKTGGNIFSRGQFLAIN